MHEPSGRSAPFSVLLLDTKHENPNGYITLAIRDALRRNPRVRRVMLAGYRDAIRLARAERFDLLLAVDGEAVATDIVARLGGLVGTSAVWFWEDPYERRVNVETAALFDLVFTSDIASVHLYGGRGCHLPLAAATELPVRRDPADLLYDLAFVGSGWPNRIVLLRRIMRELPDLRMRLALSFNPHLPPGFLDLPDADYVGPLAHEDFLAIANRSRVNLTLFREFSGDGLGLAARTPGPRLFETALAGGFQLVDTRRADASGLFAAGSEIDTFGDAAGCVAAIRAALADDDRRVAMAEAAQRRAAAAHRYDARVEVILDAAAAHAAVPAPVRTPVGGGTARPRILFVTHNIVRAGNFGGVEVYQEVLADTLRAEADIFYWRPALGGSPGEAGGYVLTDARHNVLRVAAVARAGFTSLADEAVEAEFASALAAFAIDLVHVQHLIDHPPSLPLVARLLGIPTVFTAHDFWMVCSRFNLLDTRGGYCRAAERPLESCDACLAPSGLAPGAQGARRSFMARVLESCDALVFNSDSSLAIFSEIFPHIDPARVLRLGVPLPSRPVATAIAAPAVPRPPPRGLSVAFVGNFTREKGAETLLAAAGLLRDDDVRFTILGRIDEGYRVRLADPAFAHVEPSGSYRPGEVDLGRHDLSVHLSIWPETYCITLSECWAAGVVPIVSAVGALADRVADGINGFTVPVDGAGELVRLLRDLADDPARLARVRAGIRPDLWHGAARHAELLLGRYRALLATAPRPKSGAVASVLRGAPATARLAIAEPMPRDWSRPLELDLERLEAADAPLREDPRRIRRALEPALRDGAFALSRDLAWNTDTVGGLHPAGPDERAAGFAGGNTLRLLPSGELQVIGWLRFPDGGAWPEVSLAIRALDGELVLRRVFLHERADLGEVSCGGRALGFATEPFPGAMLGAGLYAVELLVRRDGRHDLCPLALLQAASGGLALVEAEEGAIARVPLLAPPGRAVARAAAPDAIIHALDERAVRVVRQGARAVTLLAIRGWSMHADPAQHARRREIRFEGPVTAAVEPAGELREDVLKALGRIATRAPGFCTLVAADALPHGRYAVSLVESCAEGEAVVPLFVLHLPGGDAAPAIASPVPPGALLPCEEFAG